MNKKKSLFKNSGIIFVGKFSTQLISLVLLPLYTTFLSPKEYGLIDLIVTYVALLVPVVTVQMELAGFRFLVDARNNDKEKKAVISNIMQIILSISAIFSFIYLILGRFIDIPYENIILFNILASIFTNIFLQFSRGLGDNKKFAIASVVNAVSVLIMNIIFVIVLKLGLQGVILSFAIANAVSAIYLFTSLKLYRYIDLRHSDRKLKYKLLHFSLPLIPNGLSWWIISVSDRTIISIFLGLAANGLYAVSAKYAGVYSSIFAIFSLALVESVSMHINAKDSDEFISDIYNTNLKIFGSFGILLIALSPFIFNIFVGSQFRDAIMYVPILILAAFFNAIVGIYSAVYVAKKLTKKVAVTSIVAALINIVLTLGFVKLFGIYAAAAATAVAYLAMAVYRHHDIRSIVSIKYDKKVLLKVIIAYAVIIALFYVRTTLTNIISLALALLVSISMNKSTIYKIVSMTKTRLSI
jgi:O-antigen/teichoic acid export membrane protein